MADFVGSLLLEAGKYGWTEVYYPPGGTTTSALGDMQTLAGLRAHMLSADVNITPRISDITIRGDVLYGSVVFGDYATTNAMLPIPNALKMTKFSTNVYRGITYLRGLPINVVPNRVFAPDSAFTTAFTNYRTQLLAGFRLRVKDKVAPHNKIFVAIDSIQWDTRIITHRAGRPFFLPRGRRAVI